MTRTKLPSVASTVEPVAATTPLVRVGNQTQEVGQASAAFDGLPDLIVEMAEVAGLEAALAIAEARGGNRFYMPVHAADDHWLVQTVGRVAADKLTGHFALVSSGLWLDMPRGPSGLRAAVWRRLYRMIEDGRSSTFITQALGISRDTVKYHRAKLRNKIASRQLDLFALAGDPDAEE